MMLTAKGRYAVMAILEIAEVSRKSINVPITLSEISLKQNIPLNYLEQIFAKLKQANLVRSVKGPKGGYVINIALDKIKISNIIDAVNENIEMTKCFRDPIASCLPNEIKCNSHYLWLGLSNHIRSYFDGITVADILLQDQEMAQQP